jgi:multidrug efflux pump subunit AcrB
VFQVYAQADSQFRVTGRDIANMMVRNQNGDMIPIGTVAKVTPSVGPSLISLYNLYPSATIVGLPAQGYSSGQSLQLMEQIADKTLPPGTGYEWTAMSYQEKAVSFHSRRSSAGARNRRRRKSARKSIEITVFSGMLASTCLAVLFVPAFFVVVQRFEDWLAERKKKTTVAETFPEPLG